MKAITGPGWIWLASLGSGTLLSVRVGSGWLRSAQVDSNQLRSAIVCPFRPGWPGFGLLALFRTVWPCLWPCFVWTCLTLFGPV